MSADTTPAGLTAREREVLSALARGLTNDAIAIETRLSERTVRNYVSRIYQKTGVGSRVQAVLWWVHAEAQR